MREFQLLLKMEFIKKLTWKTINNNTWEIYLLYVQSMLIDSQINVITCIAKVVWLLDLDSPSSWITKLIFRPSPLELGWVLLTKALMVSGGTFEDCNEGCLSKDGWPRSTPVTELAMLWLATDCAAIDHLREESNGGNSGITTAWLADRPPASWWPPWGQAWEARCSRIPPPRVWKYLSLKLLLWQHDNDTLLLSQQ